MVDSQVDHPLIGLHPSYYTHPKVHPKIIFYVYWLYLKANIDVQLCVAETEEHIVMYCEVHIKSSNIMIWPQLTTIKIDDWDSICVQQNKAHADNQCRAREKENIILLQFVLPQSTTIPISRNRAKDIGKKTPNFQFFKNVKLSWIIFTSFIKELS